MIDKDFNKFIIAVFLVIVAYYILGYIINFITYGLIGLVIFRIFIAYQQNKK